MMVLSVEIPVGDPQLFAPAVRQGAMGTLFSGALSPLSQTLLMAASPLTFRELIPLLDEIPCHDDNAAREHLQLIHTAIRSYPVRSLVFKSLVAIEKGQKAEDVIRFLSKAIGEMAAEDSDPADKDLTSSDVAGHLFDRLEEFRDFDDHYENGAIPSEQLRALLTNRIEMSRLFEERSSSDKERQAVDEFLKLDTDIADWVLQTWLFHQQRVSDYQKEKTSLPREHREHPVRFYRSLAAVLLERARRTKRISHKTMQQTLAAGEALFLSRHVIIFESGVIRPSIRIIPKMERLRSFYRLPISQKLQQLLASAIDRFAILLRHRSVDFQRGLQGLSAAAEIFPDGPRWLQELLIHFYRQCDGCADDWSFVLKAARLLQGFSGDRVDQRGLKSYDISYIEKGARITREKFRSLVLLYGIPYHRLAYAYLKSQLSDVPVSQLATYRKPVFIDIREKDKIMRYLEASPSLGEAICMARWERDLSMREMQALISQAGMEPRWYQDMEDNKAYGSIESLQLVANLLDIPMDVILDHLLLTYFPRLKHPRLRKEPIYIDFRENADPEKIKAYEEQPGSFGEEVFFARKRRFMTVSQLEEDTGIKQFRLIDFEHNRARPRPAEIEELSRAFDIEQGPLRDMVMKTRFKARDQSTAIRITSRDGNVDWDRIEKRPKIANFRRLVKKLGVAAGEIATTLNTKFAPGIDVTQYPSSGPEPIYIADEGDEEKLALYRRLGVQSLGEVIFFARKDLKRNWSLTEAAKALKMDVRKLRDLESNLREPTKYDMERFVEVYGIDGEWLRGLVQSEERRE